MADNSLGAKVGSPVVLPVITEWVTYTPTLTNGGTTSTNTGRWRRVGSTMEVQTYAVFTAAGAAGTYTVSIPSGYSIDTTALPAATNSPGLPIGIAEYFTGTAYNLQEAFYNTSTSPNGVQFASAGASATLLGTSFASGHAHGTKFSVPIAEWAGSANVAYGAGLATSVKAGLVTPRKGEFAVTVTGTGWTTFRAVAIYYQDQDGSHRLKGNLAGSVTASARSSYTVALTGVTFKNIANFNQALTAIGIGASNTPTTGLALPNTGNIQMDHASFTTSGYSASFDVELDSKPTWA